MLYTVVLHWLAIVESFNHSVIQKDGFILQWVNTREEALVCPNIV